MKRAGIPQKLSRLIVPFLQVPPKMQPGNENKFWCLHVSTPPRIANEDKVNHPNGLPAFKFDLPGP